MSTKKQPQDGQTDTCVSKAVNLLVAIIILQHTYAEVLNGMPEEERNFLLSIL